MKPNYPIPANEVQDGMIKAGSLAVTNSSQILPVVTSWVQFFQASGGNVLASKVWHACHGVMNARVCLCAHMDGPLCVCG